MDLIAGLTWLNYLAIFVAVVVAHVAWMIFFSPKMLGKKRMESLGMTEEEMKNWQCRQTMAVSFGTVYVKLFELGSWWKESCIQEKYFNEYSFYEQYFFLFL